MTYGEKGDLLLAFLKYNQDYHESTSAFWEESINKFLAHLALGDECDCCECKPVAAEDAETEL